MRPLPMFAAHTMSKSALHLSHPSFSGDRLVVEHHKGTDGEPLGFYRDCNPKNFKATYSTTKIMKSKHVAKKNAVEVSP